MIRWLAVLALACACSNTKAPTTATDDAPDEGEVRAGGAGAHRIGTPAPALTLHALDGDPIDLAQLYAGGKPVYLKFFATWCKPCREQMPGFEKIYETTGDRMTVIAVNVGLDDDADSVRAFRAKYGLKMPVVVDDGSLAAALDLQVTPQHVLVGRDARIAYVGHRDGPKLDAAIQQVLAQSPSPTHTGAPVALAPPLHVGDVVHLDATVAAPHDARPRALVFFADWCESYLADTQPKTSLACRRVREAIEPHLASSDIAWLGIATNVWSSADSIADYQKETKTRLPIALDTDGSLFHTFDIHAMPTIALLDGTGRLVRVVTADDRDLDAAIAALH